MESSPYKKGMRVNITLLIVITTIISTLCSVVGGVWLFFKSVESLEGAVKHSSEIEVDKLKGEILLTFNEVEAANAEVLELFMSAEDTVIHSPDPIGIDPATGFQNITASVTKDWTNLIRWKAWSSIKSSKVLYDVGVMLIPHADKDPTSQYTHIWYDPKADGSREYVFGRYGQHLGPGAYNASAVPWTPSLVIANALNEQNGTIANYVYNYTFGTTGGLPLDGNVTLYTNDMYPGDSWVHGTGHSVLKRYRRPSPWYASDRNPYVFVAFDVVYLPPPPPHPWSGYKQVWVQTYFLFNLWEETITGYAKQNKDTTVLIYDQTTDIVYASSTGDKMISDACWTGTVDGSAKKRIGDCATFIVNMSKVIQAGWESSANQRIIREPSVFWKTKLDGTEHFLRHTQLFTFMPAGGVPTIDCAILWLATTDSVQKKVLAALTVFIIFACAVFVFDACMALFEIYLVAIPLTKIAKALENLQTFEPQVVMDCVKGVTLTVKEVYEVAKGLDLACRALMEYKAFLPTTLFLNDSTSDDGSRESRSSRISSTRSSHHTNTGSKATTTGVKALPTVVSLNQVQGAFVKVCFMSEELPTPDTLTAITELVEHAACPVKGTVLISPCEPGTFYVSWNVSKKVAECPRKAAIFANTVIHDKNTKLSVSVGMAHGTVSAGNIGSKSLRGFMIHGKVLMNLHAAQVYARVLQGLVGVPVVMLNSRMSEQLVGVFATVSVGVLKVGDNKPDVMHCLKNATEHETQEWMYQLDETKEDVLLEYFSQVARGAEIGLPTVEQGKLCAEQKSALTRARNGLLIEYYVKDAVQKLDMARNLVVEV
eukprot:TRINITY_DN2137_c0_g3_i1.p1 TRINITY_DN2137_c0_g3~~TRINITY_DN2137_c0_g3_i1.p1  ORF type:complete len:825 (+),score=177.47 TRINITY_DN2137_c0_g3_i1:47-2521(+)